MHNYFPLISLFYNLRNASTYKLSAHLEYQTHSQIESDRFEKKNMSRDQVECIFSARPRTSAVLNYFTRTRSWVGSNQTFKVEAVSSVLSSLSDLTWIIKKEEIMCLWNS